MNKIKKNLNLLISAVAFISFTMFMIGVMYMAKDEFCEYKYLRVLNILPISIAMTFPFSARNMKAYPKLIYGILFTFAMCECLFSRVNFSLPYANGVLLDRIFNFQYLRNSVIVNAVLLLIALICTFLSAKCQKTATVFLIIYNTVSVIFVGITNHFAINSCDSFYSAAYVLLLVCVLLSLNKSALYEDEEKINLYNLKES